MAATISFIFIRPFSHGGTGFEASPVNANTTISFGIGRIGRIGRIGEDRKDPPSFRCRIRQLASELSCVEILRGVRRFVLRFSSASKAFDSVIQLHDLNFANTDFAFWVVLLIGEMTFLECQRKVEVLV